jgi:hypothetical protein
MDPQRQRLPALHSLDLWTRGECVKSTVVLRSHRSGAFRCTAMTVDHATIVRTAQRQNAYQTRMTFRAQTLQISSIQKSPETSVEHWNFIPCHRRRAGCNARDILVALQPANRFPTRIYYIAIVPETCFTS